MASAESFQLMFCTLLIIKKPTIINAGAVAKVGTAANKGVNNTESRNRAATTIDVKPLRPPADMPEADSIYVALGEVPRIAPKVMPRALANKDLLARGSSPFSSM